MKAGVVISGDHVPRMNTAVRAVVRFAVPDISEVVSVERGFSG